MPSRIARATLIVGALDITEACLFWFFYRGASPIRIFQSVAAGLLGKSSFTGGAATAALGLALHFFIAFCVVLTYALASRRLPVLTRHPIACGAVYGVLVYLVMSFVFVPLSNAGTPKWSALVVTNGLFAHIVCVGIATALALGRERAPR
ncbi:MAG TPA: hypothetical protein VN605_09105 [Thermoanaerobaculia bacterium]|nr:hypothetical protein [Thermoanaerobaculia bacterium]